MPPPFLAFVKSLQGDEKSGAQIVLDQLIYYWSHIVPKRPPHAILCDFDEFWIYDFDGREGTKAWQGHACCLPDTPS